jgi:hypothetical protein
MNLRVNSDYYIKLHQPIDLCNGYGLRFFVVTTKYSFYYLLA